MSERPSRCRSPLFSELLFSADKLPSGLPVSVHQLLSLKLNADVADVFARMVMGQYAVRPCHPVAIGGNGRLIARALFFVVPNQLLQLLLEYIRLFAPLMKHIKKLRVGSQ